MLRPTIDEMGMAQAKLWSMRATCQRKQVGAYIMTHDGRRHVSGYNGSQKGQPHCTDVGCLMRDNHCVRTVHAESNAVAQAAREGVPLEGCTLYVTASPCLTCFQLVVAAGVKRIVYGEFYKDDLIFELAASLGVALVDGSKIRDLRAA